MPSSCELKGQDGMNAEELQGKRNQSDKRMEAKEEEPTQRLHGPHVYFAC